MLGNQIKYLPKTNKFEALTLRINIDFMVRGILNFLPPEPMYFYKLGVKKEKGDDSYFLYYDIIIPCHKRMFDDLKQKRTLNTLLEFNSKAIPKEYIIGSIPSRVTDYINGDINSYMV